MSHPAPGGRTTRILYHCIMKTVQAVWFHTNHNVCLVFTSAYKEQCRHQQIWGLARGVGDGRLRASEAGLIWAPAATVGRPSLVLHVLLTFLSSRDFLVVTLLWAEKGHFTAVPFYSNSPTRTTSLQKILAGKEGPAWNFSRPWAGKWSSDLLALFPLFGHRYIDAYWGL